MHAVGSCCSYVCASVRGRSSWLAGESVCLAIESTLVCVCIYSIFSRSDNSEYLARKYSATFALRSS